MKDLVSNRPKQSYGSQIFKDTELICWMRLELHVDSGCPVGSPSGGALGSRGDNKARISTR